MFLLLLESCKDFRCDPSGDSCINGLCRCGNQDPCSGTSDRCENGMCMCGPNPPCSLPASNRCVKGKCMCGKDAPCKLNSRTPICLEKNLDIPIAASNSATCKVTLKMFVNTITIYKH